MNILSPEIIVAAIMMVGTIIGNWLGNRHQKHLIAHRLEQVEKKLDGLGMGNIRDRLARTEIRLDVLEGRK